MLEGKRSRGKQREKLIEGLTDWLKAGKSLEAIEATKDRKKWRTMIANAYLLPRLMKSGDEVLNYMIQYLSTQIKEKQQQAQGAIIMCLHRARTLGFLKFSHMKNQEEGLWLGYLSPNILKEALCSMDDQIRLDAFALVCENSKTSEVVTSFEFDLLKFFIPLNTNNQYPAFRQTFFALIKKLIFRVKESLLSLKRKSKHEQGAESEALMNYESFLHWLTTLTVDNIYPGAAFAHRTTNLAILSLMTSCFTSDCDGFSVPKVLQRHHTQALLACLTDTFEDNRKETFNIISCFLKYQEPIWDHSSAVELMRTALALSCSTRPQDCDTAVYLFLSLLKQQEFYAQKFDFADLLNQITHDASQITKPGLSSHPKLLLLCLLLQSLDNQIAVAEQSLMSAAANRPMYPTLHCIRYVLQEVNFKTMDKDHLPSAKDFIKDLINSCLHLSRVVSPVVQNSSPEGNVPDEAVSDLEPPNAEWSRALVESMPEYLVVCGWRSIKEVSLTLGSLCLQLPTSLIKKDEGNDGLLSLMQVTVIGEYFNQQLLESIHRGAFELAYAGFQLVCQMLWSHPLSCFHQLPSTWLSAVLEDIKSNDPDSRLCATRRSAGIPFLVQAIASTEPSLTGRQTFHSAMKELLHLAIEQQNKVCVSAGPIILSSSDAQVHALNILRALYRESRLRDDVVPYVADGLKSAILGFRSEQWAVRNSATLLLSSLMTRIFGVKRSKDETAMSKKNCQTGRAFFHRYPTLYPFLLSELEAATMNVISSDRLSLHPSLYPVLLVLGRLFPSTLEGSDTSLSLSAFIPYVIKCASSPVYKTRVIASRAIQPLAKRNEVIAISCILWNILPEHPSSGKFHSSQMHGSLLQLTELIKLVESFSTALQWEALEAFGENMCKRKWMFENLNPCFATRQAALILTDSVLNVAECCLTSNGNTSRENILSSIGSLKEAFLSAIFKTESHDQRTFLPFFFELEKTRAQLCLKYLTDICNFRAKSFVLSDMKQSNLDMSAAQERSEAKYDLLNVAKPNADYVQLNDCSMAQTIIQFLKSPIYDTRLGILDILLISLNTNEKKESHFSSLLGDDLDSHSQQNIQALTGVRNLLGAEDVASELLSQLLTLAMETETHHLCVEKVFYLLAIWPQDISQLFNESKLCLKQMLSQLMNRIMSERRIEVKAAIMKFSGRLVSILYEEASQTQIEDGRDNLLSNDTVGSNLSKSSRQLSCVLTEWVMLLKDCSSADENPALEISCCHCLLQNAHYLLKDPSNILKRSVYMVWDSLAALLQDDDLEVKEIAANIVSAISGKEQGSYQPSYALHILPCLLISLNGTRDLSGVLSCLISWILNDDLVDVKESSERLFDKGEMNTYLDHVIFTRSIMESLHEMLYSFETNKLPVLSQTGLSDSSQHKINSDDVKFYHQLLLNCKLNGPFISFLERCVAQLVTSLHALQSSCKTQDMLMNIGRFRCLAQTLHKVRQCYGLIRNFSSASSVLQKSLDSLEISMAALESNFSLTGKSPDM
ncbi:thyroid adenoma-associated-like protein [Plakobranchus ocellatus]|uniref:tRNA (32-2'-O)-methyltransferase regulator THADA n=1 Tax=Plakobranchus ocellatus TaxID=259542 RepID=A0AAV4CNQ9_9GAST|nr:thyroid adenoma-associated-like protein [Plakobranchus ocellatus]